MSSDQPNYDWVEDLIDSMASEFDPSSKVNADALEDGNYVFKITDMELSKIEQTGNPILRWSLKIEAGPSCVGANVDRTSYFAKPVALNILGSDLVLLGSLDREWKKSGVPLSKLLMGAISKSIGKVFNGRKKANTNQSTGKTYHNITVTSLKKSESEEPEQETPF